MHLEKSVMGMQLRAFKNCSKWTPPYKEFGRWKSLYFEQWINARTPSEEQSNQDWNIPIYMSTYVLWSFGFLSWLSSYVFITNCGLNGYVYIFEIILVTLNKLICDFRNICGCLTLNKILIKLASLVISSINDNLTNTSSKTPPEVKKQYCI